MARVSVRKVEKGVSAALGVVSSGVAIAGLANQVKAIAVDRKTWAQALDLTNGVVLLASGGLGALALSDLPRSKVIDPLVEAVKVVDLATALYGAVGILYNTILVPQVGFPPLAPGTQIR